MSLQRTLTAVGTAAVLALTPAFITTHAWAQDPPPPSAVEVGPSNSYAAGGIAPVTHTDTTVTARQVTEPLDAAAGAQAAADWIVGTWDSNPSAYVTAGNVADGILALASVDAPDANHQRAIGEMLARLAEMAPQYVSPSEGYLNASGLGKVLLAVDAANQDARHFLGCDRDLVAELLAEVDKGGSNVTLFWAPHMIALSLSRLGVEVPQSVIDQLLSTQQAGAFGYWMGTTFAADPDYTAVGMESMWLIANSSTATAEQKQIAQSSVDAAIGWAQDPANQKSDETGYFWETYSAANSTGMLAGALAEAGVNIESPQAFMLAQQALTGTGAWSNVRGGTASDLMATTQAVMALTGKGYATTRSSHYVNQVSCPAPSITTQPTAASVPAGTGASFTVVAENAVSYQWQRLVDATWTPIDGATEATLTLPSVTAADDGAQFRVVVTNSVGSVESDVATLTVTPAPTWVADACTGDEGVTVVVDYAFRSDEAPDLQRTVVRCVLGDPSTGLQVLEDGGFALEPVPGFGGTVRTINGVPADPYPVGWLRDGYWSYWQGVPGGDWSYSNLGASMSDPAPGAVEGWRYVSLSGASLPPSVGPTFVPGLDTTAPQISIITRPADSQKLTATVVFQIDDQSASATCTVNGAAEDCPPVTSWTSLNRTWEITGLRPGPQALTIRAVDAWGNESTQTITFTVEQRFTDVPSDSFFLADIYAVADKGLMQGYSETVFGHDDPILREQMALILYRMGGEEPVDHAQCVQFTDVPTDSHFADAICWANAKGIAHGYGDGRFGYGDHVLREQMVMFLYRMANSPEVEATGCHTFADVPADSHFADAICWAKQTGITTGYSATSFGFGELIVRKEQAAFLNRMPA